MPAITSNDPAGTALSGGSEIRYEVRDGLARIVLDAPQRLNALSPAMMEGLVDALRRAEQEARAVLLSGTGRSFCSGVDLSSGPAIPHADLDGGAILEDHVNPMIAAIEALRIPLIAAVQGAAAGLGMALALSCDIIVVGRSGYFLAPFARIGLLPDGGIPALLHRAIGRVRATQLLMLAEKLPAEKALDWGLVTQMVEDGDLMNTAEQVAMRLAQGPTIAFGGMRRMLWSANTAELDAELALEREMQRTIPATLDCQEGNAAFREKRAPRFTGQ